MQKYFLLIPLFFVLFTSGGCVVNKAQTGAGIGGLVGSLAGVLMAKDKLVGGVLGAASGAVAGYMIGNEMDKYDQEKIREIAEKSKSKKVTTWTNPDTGHKFTAVPSPAYSDPKDSRIRRDIIIRQDDDEPVKVTVIRNGQASWAVL